VVFATVTLTTTAVALSGMPPIPATCTVSGSVEEIDGLREVPEFAHWPVTPVATSSVPPMTDAERVSHIRTGDDGVRVSPVDEK